MSDKKIDSIVEELRSEEERLKSELADLKKREQALTRDLKTVQSGLSGMAGKAGKARKRSAAKKPSPQEAPREEAVNEERQGEMALEAFP